MTSRNHKRYFRAPLFADGDRRLSGRLCGVHDTDETLSLTLAMANVGNRLDWGMPLVLDKHCIGGIPGCSSSDGVDAPRRHLCAKVGVGNTYEREASMVEVTMIGLDIAKNAFQAHSADAAGRHVFSRRIARGKVLEFFAGQLKCLVALEACGGAHHWAASRCAWATK